MIAIAATCLIVVIAVWANSNRTPSYNGRNIQDWFSKLSSESPEERKQAEIAFDAFGADSLNFLLSQLTADVPSPTSRFQTWVNEKILKRPQVIMCGMGIVTAEHTQAQNLKAAFGVLGKRAQPSVKKINELLSDPLCRHEAAASLVAIGQVAWSEIQAAVNSKDLETRLAIVSALAEAKTQKTNACNLLIKALKDSDGLVRHYAASAIGELGVCPDQSVTELTAVLKDSDSRVRYISVFALQKFGTNAIPAISSIRQLQNDPEENIRKNAFEIADSLESINLPHLQ